MQVESLDTIIHEEEFLPLLEKNMQTVFGIFNFMKTKEDAALPRKFFAKLEEETNELENWLSDFVENIKSFFKNIFNF